MHNKIELIAKMNAVSDKIAAASPKMTSLVMMTPDSPANGKTDVGLLAASL